jgi:hypothetical protein
MPSKPPSDEIDDDGHRAVEPTAMIGFALVTAG